MKRYQDRVRLVVILVSVSLVAGLWIAFPAAARITLPQTTSSSATSGNLDHLPRMEAKLNLPATAPTPTPEVSRQAPFRVGEELVFSVNWGAVNAGTATMTIKDIIDFQGHPVYQVVVIAESNSFFSVFFRVHDIIESLIDVKGLFTRRYWLKQEEGEYKQERVYEFHQEQNEVRYREQSYYIRHGIQDEISAIYYVRTQDLKVGTPIYVDMFAKRRNWQVRCGVLREETVKVPAGEFETILVEPELQFDGIMKKGKVQVWLTNDAQRMPVKIETHVAMIGAMTLKLERYQLGTETAYHQE